MKTAVFEVEILPSEKLVASTLAGFFDQDTARKYIEEAERVIRLCLARHGRYRMLLDLSRCAIQSQNVVAAFLEHVQRMPVAERSAVIVGSSIVRMQIRRVMDRPHVRLFEDRAEARAWIGQTAPAYELHQASA